MFIQAEVDVQNLDASFFRKELNDLKIEVSDLKIHVEALLKKSNQQLSSPIKRKGNDGSIGKQSLSLKNILINLN